MMSPAPKLCIATTVPICTSEGVVSFKPDQIRVIIRAFLGLRETITRHVKLGAGERLARFARGHAFDACDRPLRALAQDSISIFFVPVSSSSGP